MSKVYIINAKRSPIGKFLGSLSSLRPSELAGQVIKKTIEESNIDPKTVDEVIGEVLRDKSFFESSGGGMTLSGGEPFYQPDFAIEILKAAKNEGINCAVETCGMAASEVFINAAPYVDLFLFDYKAQPAIDMKRSGIEITRLIAGKRMLIVKRRTPRPR